VSIVIDQLLAGKGVDLAFKGVRGGLRAFRAQPDSLGRLLVLLHADLGCECDLGRDVFCSWRRHDELCDLLTRVLAGELLPGQGVIGTLADVIEPRLIRTRQDCRRQLAERIARAVFRAAPIVVDGGGEATRLLLAHVDAVAARPDTAARNPARRVRLNVPMVASSFTGRERELEELHTTLAGADRAVITQAISGLGGVGKSQLAARYLQEHSHECDVVAWIRAEDGGIADLAQLAGKLGVPVEGLSPSDRAQLALNWLSECEQCWLLVLDNVESAEQLAVLCSRGGNGRVLVTSRDRSLRQFGPVLTLDVFDEDTAAAYLTQCAGRPDDESSARELAEALGCLPLALSHAAAYCQSGTSFANYRELLGELPAHELLDTSPELTYAQTTASTWKTSIEAACAIASLAGDVLEMGAHLGPDAIPKLLFLELVDAHTARGRKRLSDALNALARFSLATVNDDTVSMHRLLQKVIRDDRATRDDLTPALRALTALANTFPSTAEVSLSWPLCEQLLPHAFALADVLPEPGASAPQLIELLNRASRYLHFADPGERCLSFAQRALTYAERVLGADRPEALTARQNLAIAHALGGHYEEATMIYEPLLADRERVLGADHHDTLRTRGHLGISYRQVGRNADAIAIYEQQIAYAERILGTEHPDTLDVRDELANAYRAAGRIQEATLMFQALLTDRQRILGSEHLDTLRSRHNLAVTYHDAGRNEKAIAILEALLADRQRILGDEHAHVLGTRHDLGFLYQAAGRNEKAIAILEALLPDRQRILGTEHAHTRDTRDALADAYQAAGSDVDAASTHRSAEATQSSE
jgi:tetratricopeptide (TPR) repeat protein